MKVIKSNKYVYLKDTTFSPQSTDIENNQDDYFEDEVTEVNYVSFNYCSA